MNLRSKKEMAARLLHVGTTRIRFNPAKLEDVKEALTRQDFKKLAMEGTVLVKQKQGVSRGRARKSLIQKRKGRQKGQGSRKGSFGARVGTTKMVWVHKIRAQREVIANLLDKKLITKEAYRDLRSKSKGGYFRSVRHIKLYLDEKGLWIKK